MINLIYHYFVTAPNDDEIPVKQPIEEIERFNCFPETNEVITEEDCKTRKFVQTEILILYIYYIPMYLNIVALH